MLTGSSFFRLFRKLRMGGEGIAVRTLTGALSLTVLEEQVAAYDPGGASRNVTIHVDDNVVGNWRAFYNSADADGENLVIKNSAGTTIVTAGRGETVVVAYGGSTPAWTKVLGTDSSADILSTANTWSAEQTFGAGIALLDADAITLGTGDDDNIAHDGTNTTWTHTTGDLIFDNTDTNDQIIFRVGTDTTATGIEFRNNTDVFMWKVEPISASAGRLMAADNSTIVLGAGSDDTISHDGTNSSWIHTTGDLTFDNQLATGSTIFLLGTDTSATDFQVQNNSAAAIFSVTPSSATDGTTAIAGLLDLNGKLDLDVPLTTTGDGANIAVTMNHATLSGEGLDVSIAQITNVRTGGYLSAIKASITSLVGDTAGVDYYAYEAAVTVGEAAADHFVLKQGVNFDETIDSSLAASTEAGWLVAANVANAWHLKSSALTYAALRTSTATPGIDETFTLTATGDAHNIAALVNSGTGVVQALDVSISTVTTAHTAGLLSAIRASVTSLAADSGGDFACLELASVDGGGVTPVHSGIYCAAPLDALIKVGADGQGGVVIGSTMTISPEATAESGYFKFNVGAVAYQVPIYAA